MTLRSKLPAISLAFAAGCAIVACGGAVTPPRSGMAAPDAARTTPLTLRVPLHQSAFNPALRYLDVSVGGGKPVAVLLDTGSSGLRIFANAVGRHVTRKRFGIVANFHGNVWAGVLAKGTVAIGSYQLPKRVAFELVTRTYCADGTQNCRAAAGVRYYEKLGFYGIFGVNESAIGFPSAWASPSPGASATPPAVNPGRLVYNVVAQLPEPLDDGYIVSFSSETLQIGLSLPRDRKGFSVERVAKATHPNGRNAFAASHFATCWSIRAYVPFQPCWFSGPDSGGGSSILKGPAQPPARVYAKGAFLPNLPVSVTFFGLKPPFTWNFNTGSKAGIDEILWSQNGCAHADLATDPYHAFDFLYDVKDLLFGLRAAPGTAISVPSPVPTPSLSPCPQAS